MIPLQNLEQFMRLLHKVQNVKRVARIPDEAEYRNTAEHTFELALLSWYIASVNKLDLDHGKILKYALAHDLIEGYAGDTPAHDVKAQKLKAAKEAAALARIEEEFSEFPDLLAIIHAYEARADAESRFVYATDKLVDPLNASMEETQSIWKDLGMSYEYMREYKDRKIALSEHIVPYWQQLLAKLEAKRDFFFPQESER